jgi:2-polyprenyl-3-methyl-5-hydroxy-6-metoxy-1,4-benzoquinol methylase
MMETSSSKTIWDVRKFWESNPLWVGESKHEQDTIEFFEEHRKVVLEDCLAGKHDQRILPSGKNRRKILDIGCGPGLWTAELFQNGCKDVVSADLTSNALKMTRKRCNFYGFKACLAQQNAETLAFKDGVFSHVNCLGVIHHTPDTKACISEIARVLEKNGTATISLYYKNVILRMWPLLKWAGKILSKTGAALSGRGREDIYSLCDIKEIVRLFDGKDNPIGKSYSRIEFIRMVAHYFDINEMFVHYFPARTLPFDLPQILHKALDRNMGFMIYATLRKNKSSYNCLR